MTFHTFCTQHTHIYKNCDTTMRPSASDNENQINQNNNNSDGHHNSMDTQQDNVGIHNAYMPCIEHNDGPKGIQTRSGQINQRPQSQGIIEE